MTNRLHDNSGVCECFLCLRDAGMLMPLALFTSDEEFRAVRERFCFPPTGSPEFARRVLVAMARPVVAAVLRRYLSFHSDPLRAPLLTKNLFRDLLLADFQTHFLVCGDQMCAGSRYWIMLARSVLAVLGWFGRGCLCVSVRLVVWVG